MMLWSKNLTIFAQYEKDAVLFASHGFQDVLLLTDTMTFEGITLHKTNGIHGHKRENPHLHVKLGKMNGVVLEQPEEKTLYISYDTVWNLQIVHLLE